MNYNSNKKNFFDNFAKRYIDANFADMSPSSKVELKALLDFFDLKPGSKVIELGCGGGRFVIPLALNNCKVTGVDISQKALDIVKRNVIKLSLNDKVMLVKNDFSTAKYHEEFDYALMVSTLHQLDDSEEGRVKIFSNLVEAVKQGGEILLLQPNAWNPIWHFIRFHPDIDWKIEKNCVLYSFRNLEQLYKKLGLKNVKIKHFGWLPTRLVNKFPFVEHLNVFLCKLPIIKKFSLFVLIKATK